MKIYAMSDIHGCLMEFHMALSMIDLSQKDTILILLGDYIHGPESYGVLDKIIALQQKYGSDKVVALMGNHEKMAINGDYPIHTSRYQYDARSEKDDIYIAWMKNLPLYYVTEKQIFCHAGVDETLGEHWEQTDENTFLWKFPAQTGKFCMDIIAGHVGTSQIAKNIRFHDIYFDGQSHYYIDGSTLSSGILPVIMVDTDTNQYYRVTESGNQPILPYREEYSHEKFI